MPNNVFTFIFDYLLCFCMRNICNCVNIYVQVYVHAQANGYMG